MLLVVTVQACCIFCAVKVLGKSVKPIPVMILGVLLARKKYPWLKYLFVLMITTGVALFMYKPSKVQASSEMSPVFGWGELLLVCATLRLLPGWVHTAWKTLKNLDEGPTSDGEIIAQNVRVPLLSWSTDRLTQYLRSGFSLTDQREIWHEG